MTKAIVLLVVSVVLGTIRAMGHTSPAFQAAAHLFVGGLIGACLQAAFVRADNQELEEAVFNQMLYGFLAGALTVLEVVCFVVFRFVGHA